MSANTLFRSCPAGSMRCAVFLLATLPAVGHASVVARRPLERETELARAGSPVAVILVPDTLEYQELGQQLAAAIAVKTGVRLSVERAADYVSRRPRTVKPERLDRPFILVGQFWNNAVLECLYAGYFDPADAFFPGPGGWELRTVCRPFRPGHNCIVATGSDLAGCRKAAAKLLALIEGAGPRSRVPFLHRIQLVGEAEQVEADHHRHMAPILAELDRYAVFGHPQGKLWTGENPHDFLVWEDRNLATAAVLGLRFWASGDRQDAEAFKRLVLGCRQQLDRLAQAYREGRVDLMDYSGGALTIDWDLIEESDAFTDAERDQITDYLFQLAYLNRDSYYVYKCNNIPLADIDFRNRHFIAGTFWLGREADSLARNCVLTDAQQRLTEQWRADAQRYRQRLAETPFYSDGVALIHDEGGVVLRSLLMSGDLDPADGSWLRQLADCWVVNHDNLGQMTSSGTNGSSRSPAAGGEVLNVAGWLFPGEGYHWFRRRLGRWPYQPFLFYATVYGFGFPYFNYEMPPTDDGSARLKARMDGMEVLPVGEAYQAHLQRHPDLAQGGYQRLPGRYQLDAVPYTQSWKRIALRSGFEPADQYLALDGMQGMEWSYDDINAIARYDDLGQTLLKAQWDARSVESRLEMNTLLVSRGVPGAKQSVEAALATTADLGPETLLGSRAACHDDVAWTRNLFWRKNAWFLVADEVRPRNDGDHFLAQTWLSWHPFAVHGAEAMAQAGDVRFHVVGTPERSWFRAVGSAGPEGIRQQVTAKLTQGRPFTLWTLLYASGPQRPARWRLQRIAENAVLLSSAETNHDFVASTLAFTGSLALEGVRVTAERGLISTQRLTLANCRKLSVGDRALLSSPTGTTFAWDLEANRFEAGKPGFGLTPGAHPEGLEKWRTMMAQAVRKCLAVAASQPAFFPPEVSGKAGQLPGTTPLPIAAHYQLRTPVSLASSDPKGDGNDELLLYDASGKARFDYPSFRAEPVVVHLDGAGPADIAFSLDKAVAIYHRDGRLRWRQELSDTATALCVGDLDGDGREELGLSLDNYALALDHAQRRLVDEDVFRYTGLACAVGDVDGDGQREFVGITISGVNVLKPGRSQCTAAKFQSFFGTSPCRLWLRDLDGDGVPEGFLGGGGSDPACYDLKRVRCKWTFAGASVHPRDVALWDADGDGQPEMVSGGDDGFLYVAGCRDGKFRLSRSVGAGINVLAVVPGAAGGGGALAVGLETGRVLLIGRGLTPMAWAELGEPVVHLAVLRQAGRPPAILAAGSDGHAIRIELAHHGT